MAGSYAMDQAVSWQAVVFSSIVGETILDYCSLKECNKMQLLSLSTSRWGFVINRMIHWDAQGSIGPPGAETLLCIREKRLNCQ